MNETPKISKGRGRYSLSLKKRPTVSSPKSTIIAPTEKVLFDSPKDQDVTTTPHKKLNLDESLDDSPMSEGCYSPTSFLSQTFRSDSPEVSWNWEKDKGGKAKTDSGFLSSNSTNMTDSESRIKRKRDEKHRREYINKRMNRRREKEMRLRKVQMLEAESLLKLKLTQLQNTHNSQLKSIQTTEQPQSERVPEQVKDELDEQNHVFDDLDNIFEQSSIDFENPKPVTSEEFTNDQINLDDCFDDFFNDADADELLVEATQKLESVMPELTQALISTQTKCSTNPPVMSSKIQMETPKRDKRSSLYMEFLEEDDGDDFFVSLDDDWLREATQPSKTRSPFQRYKSMPTSTTVTSSSSSSSFNAVNGNLKANESSKNTSHPNEDLKKTYSNASNATSSPSYKPNTIRRHASSHAMSPTRTNYRRLQQPSRN